MIYLTAAVTYLFANLFYWNVGRSTCRLFSTKPRLELLYPLVGIIVIGFSGQLTFFAGMNAGAVTFALGVLSLAGLALKALSPREKKALMTSTLLFSIAGFIQSLVPYPGLGKWSGDWNFHYLLGGCLLRGEVCSELVARPPLFGAAFLPLRWWSEGLLSYQVGNAVVSSAAALSVLFAARRLKIRLSPSLLALTLLITPFFALHDTYPWPKLLSGACVLMAAIFTAQFARRPDRQAAVAAGLWLAFAINAHHSAVLCAPLLFVLVKPSFLKQPRSIAALVGICLLAVLLVAAPYEVWAFTTFGLERRITENAGVSWRFGDPVKGFPRILFTTFITRAPWEIAEFMRQNTRTTFFHWLALFFFVVSTWVTAMAGTLGGLILPWILSSQWRSVFSHAKKLLYENRLALPAMVLTILFHTAAFPHDTYVGTTQAGLVPLCLVVFLGLYSYLRVQKSSARRKQIILLTVLTGTVPFLLSQFLPLLALKLGGSKFTEKALPLLVASDEDAKIYLGNHMTSWGYGLFPWGIFLSGVFLYAAIRLYRARLRLNPASRLILSAREPS